MADVKRRRAKRKLIEGRMMRCPRCKNLHDLLQYVPMQLIEEFASDTTTIYKCPKCRWIFAPIDDVVFEIFRQRNGAEEEEVVESQ